VDEHVRTPHLDQLARDGVRFTRGSDVAARFAPPVEQLAFPIAVPGEADLPGIYADPVPAVLEALRAHDSADSLWECLPDVELQAFPACQGDPPDSR